jgi:hypothetical protein
LTYNAFFEGKKAVIRERLWQAQSDITAQAHYKALSEAENEHIGLENAYFRDLKVE